MLQKIFLTADGNFHTDWFKNLQHFLPLLNFITMLDPDLSAYVTLHCVEKYFWKVYWPHLISLGFANMWCIKMDAHKKMILAYFDLKL